MHNGFLQRWPRVPEGQNLQFRKKILLFSIFLLISIFIWLLNALSKNYTSVIKYPLTYLEMPEESVTMGDLPEHLDLRVNAHGYALLRYKVFRKPVPINFNLSAYTLNRPGQDSSKAYILTRYLRDQVSRQLPPELQLLEIRPDTLHFQFAKKVTRRVKIHPDFRFRVAKQFTVKDGIVLEPDFVNVTGPDLILDTLSGVYTEQVDLGLLSKSFSDKVRLKRVDDLNYDRSRVNCTIELEKFTEVKLSIPIEVLNLPDSLVIQTFPSRVSLTCTVGLSKYERMDGNLFRAVVDYSDIGEDNQLEVDIQNIPLYLISYDYYPKRVEFLMSKK